MKAITVTIILILIFPVVSWSQAYRPSNSFDSIYQQSNPTLSYQYDDVTKIHNYSGNWDFDSDGIKDQLFFIGTDGAHPYYYLRIVLSSDTITRDYPFLLLDFPVLPGHEKLKGNYNPLETFTPFAVFDSDKDGSDDIFLHIDNSTATFNSKQLKKHGINSKALLITFKNRKIRFTNFS